MMNSKMSCGLMIVFFCIIPSLLWAQTVTFSMGSSSGERGTLGHPVEVSTGHIVDLGRVAFTVEYDPAKLDVSTVRLADRVIEGAGLSFNWSNPVSGRVSVVIERESGIVIGRGIGAVAMIVFDVAEDAPVGEASLDFSEVTAENVAGTSLQTVTEDGSFTIFISPHIALSAESHDFGGILVGSSDTWTLTISNVGTDILTVENLSTNNSRFTLEAPELPQLVNPDQSFDLQVTFSPTGLGSVAGSLKVRNNDPEVGLLSLFLTGEGVLPDIAIADESHDFGQVAVGTTSLWGMYIYNEGKYPLVVMSLTCDHPDFTVDAPRFPKVIGALDSIEVTMAFSPQGVGAASSIATVISEDADEETLTVSLSGQGVDVPEIEVSALEHDFGRILRGSSAEWILTISNNGTSDLTIERIDINNNAFIIISHVFPVTVPAGEQIDVSLMFAPREAGIFVVEMTVVSNDPDEGNLVVTLRGEGIVPTIELSTTNHDFGGIVRGTSVNWSFTISNTGTAELTISSVSSDDDDFSILSPNFPQTVDTSGSVEVTVVFAPTGLGSESAVITISSDDPDHRSTRLNLSGESLYPVLAPSDTTHHFGGVVIDSLAMWTMVIANGGSAQLTIDEVSSSHGDFSVVSPSFPQTLGVSGSVDVLIHFVPTSQGPLMAQLTLHSDDPVNETVLIELTGIGIPPVTLSVDRSTGEPGEQGVTIPVVIDNVVPVAQAECSFLFDPALLHVTDVTATGRAINMKTFSWSEIGPGQIVLLLKDFTGHPIVPGIGPIALIEAAVAETAPPTTVELQLAGAAAFDSSGRAYEIQALAGLFTVLVEDIHMVKTEHDFGEVGVGVQAEWIVAVQNAGTKELTIDSLLSGVDVFTVAQPGFPQTVLPSGEIEITIVFAPLTVGPMTGQLAVFSSDPDEDSLSVSLIGEGVSTAFLEVVDGSGASGSTGNLVQIQMRNWVDVSGLECVLSYNAQKLSVTDVQPTARSESLGLLSWTRPAPGQVRIVLSSIGGQFIPAGSGAVADLFVAVDEQAPAGDVALSLHGVKVYDINEEPLISEGQGGIFAVGSPAIRIEVLDHSYGYVAVGDSGTWVTHLFNDGVFDLEIVEVLSDEDPFVAFFPDFPQTVFPGGSLAVTILFVPADTGMVRGTMTIVSNDPDQDSLNLSVSGIGAAPKMTIPVSEYAFGTVGVGSSVEWQFAVFNMEPVNLLVYDMAIDRPEFEIVWPTLFPLTIPPGNHIGAIISFTPADTGLITAAMTIESNDREEPSVSITLTGRGGLHVPDIAYSASGHDFGSVAIGASVDWVFTIANEGLMDLNIGSIFSSDDAFSVLSPTTPQRLEPNASLFVVIQFTPTVSAPVEGQLTISSDDPDEPTVSILLSGRGEAIAAPEIQLSAYGHLFGQIVVGQVSDWELVISNGGTADLTIHEMRTNHAEFDLITPDFPQVVAPDGDLITTVRFAPLSAGMKAGVISITSDDPDEGTVQVDVAGEALPSTEIPRIGLSATEYTFGSVRVGDDSVWSLRIANTGLADLLISSIVSDQASFGVSAPPFPITIVPGDERAVNVIFAPTSQGLKAGALSISSNDPEDPEVHVFVSGTGLAPVAVQLLDFSATSVEDQVLLSWRTSCSEGLASFRLFRRGADEDDYHLLSDAMVKVEVQHYRYVDRSCTSTGVYHYRLVALDYRGSEMAIGLASAKIDGLAPSEIMLLQNYPNPFNPETTIQYGVDREGWVEMAVFNLLGQRVATLVSQYLPPGKYAVTWKGDDGRGHALNSGLYTARLKVHGDVAYMKMMLLK